jgi:hypothetical protein
VRGHRILLTFAVVAWSASLAIINTLYIGSGDSDFAPIWIGARGVLEHQNPYDLVGPGLLLSWAYPLLYPFTAILVAIPFALVPLWLANLLFSAIGGGLLAWALTKERLADPRLLVFLSLPFFLAGLKSQWSPLLTAAALLPGLGWAFACKPTVGLTLLLYRPSVQRFALAGLLGVVSLLLWPRWPFVWLDTITAAPHISPPIVQPWGWLLLSLLVFWRESSARLILIMACLPQSPLIYEAVVLFLVVRTWGEAAWLWLTTFAVWWFVPINVVDPTNVYEALPANAPKMVLAAYLPAAVIVLRQGWMARAQSKAKILTGSDFVTSGS